MTGARPAYFGGHATPPARYNPAAGAPNKAAAKPTATTAVSAGGPQSILQLVQQILGLERAPLATAEAERQAQVAREQHDMQAARTALVAQLQQGASTGGQAYDQAITATDALGRQAASYFQSQSPDAATQATLKAIGAPLSQQQAVGAQNTALFNGGPNYVLGAQIPGASLAAQKAAQVGMLAGLPTVAALQGQTGERALLQGDQAAHQTYVQNLQRVAAQAPGLVQSYQNQAIQQASAARSAAASAAAALANRQYLLAKEGFTQQQITLATVKEQHAYDLATQNADISQQRADAYNQSVTNTYALGKTKNTIAARNADTAAEKAKTAAKVAAAAAAGKKVKAGKTRQSYFYTQRSKAIADAKKLYGGPSAAGAGLSFSAPKYTRPARASAYNKLYLTYQPILAAQGFKGKTITQMVNRALTIAGYPAPTRTRKPGRAKPGKVTPLNPMGG